MRRNNFTSASDRRWQRRYERIQQRREEELERRDRQGRDDAYKVVYDQSLGIDQLAVYAQLLDEPNRNGTIIPSNVWAEAMDKYSRRANERRRSLVKELIHVTRAEVSDSERRDVSARLRDTLCEEILEAFQNHRRDAERQEHTTQETEQVRGYRAQTMVVDDYSGTNIWFKNGDYIIIDDLVPAFEPELELKAGDETELDSFLGNFFTSEAYLSA